MTHPNELTPLTIHNRWINTETYPCEVLGFFEEIFEAKTGRLLGTIRRENLDRPLGADGRLDFELTSPTELRRGHKLTTMPASPDKPVKVWGMMQVLCGQEKRRPVASRMLSTFNEADCGGVFDGNGVVSDADPGL